MTDHTVFSRRCVICLLATLIFLSLGFSHTATAQDFGGAFSDMGGNTHRDAQRPGLADIDRETRETLSREYRSPDYDEKQFFAKYVERVPPQAILDFLEREEATCHRQAHELGRAIFRKYQDINKALRICGNGCTNACMHGAVGEAFADLPLQTQDDHAARHDAHGAPHHNTDMDRVTERMEQFCHQGDMARLHKRGNCAHAMGHALMLKTDHDLHASLTACSEFAEPGMDYYCATGVYMQYMDNAAMSGARERDIRQYGANYPCNEFTAYPAACYRYVVSEVKREQGLGLEHLIMLCAQLPDDVRAGCFHGLGATYTPAVKRYPGLLRSVCSFGGRSDQVLCIEGVVEKLADFNEQWALAACESLDDDKAEICVDAARGKMYRLNKPTMELYRVNMPMRNHSHE